MLHPLPHRLAQIGMVALALLSGCGDDEPAREPQQEAAQAATQPAAGTQEHREKWLQPGSKLTAAQWLVSRTQPAVQPLHDPEVQRVAMTLDTANKLYRESERMIANRAVQLEGMLRDSNIEESAIEILDDLTAVAGEIGQTEGFGALSQHYFNLRSNDIGRGEALATLKSRYGRRP